MKKFCVRHGAGFTIEVCPYCQIERLKIENHQYFLALQYISVLHNDLGKDMREMAIHALTGRTK